MATTDYEYSAERLQEIKNDTNAIKTHAKWVLSILIAIALGLASFVFTDLGELHIIYKELNKPDLLIKIFSGLLFALYSLLMMLFIPWIFWGIKLPADNEDIGLQSRIEEAYKTLVATNKRFRMLIILLILSPLLSAEFAIYFTYFA